jgi:hypothetical protein
MGRATDGLLRPTDRARLLAQGVILILRTLPVELRRSLGLRPSGLARFDVAALRVPDTPAACAAERLSSELTPPVADSHSHRSYVWAAILAAHDGIRYDQELLYVASPLHDLGWADPAQGRPFARRCFTLTGAQAALELEAGQGWDQRRKEAAAEAITLHLNLVVGLRHGPEAHLLHAGTRLDATGYRHWQIASETVGAVLARHPRQGLKEAWCTMMAAQADAA